jgi:hypothetical protein
MMDSRDSAAFLPLQEDQRVTAMTRTRTELTEKRETSRRRTGRHGEMGGPQRNNSRLIESYHCSDGLRFP